MRPRKEEFVAGTRARLEGLEPSLARAGCEESGTSQATAHQTQGGVGEGASEGRNGIGEGYVTITGGEDKGGGGSRIAWLSDSWRGAGARVQDAPGGVAMATGGRPRASLRASGPWKVRRAGDGAELDLSQDRAASEAGRASGRGYEPHPRQTYPIGASAGAPTRHVCGDGSKHHKRVARFVRPLIPLHHVQAQRRLRALSWNRQAIRLCVAHKV